MVLIDSNKVNNTIDHPLPSSRSIYVRSASIEDITAEQVLVSPVKSPIFRMAAAHDPQALVERPVASRVVDGVAVIGLNMQDPLEPVW